jgi:hypothetical protein
MRIFNFLAFGLEGIIPGYDKINTFIDNAIDLNGYIDQAYDALIAQDSITLLIGFLLVGIIVLMGLFSLIKKLSKIIIVVAILAGLYLLYQNDSLSGILGG